MLLDHYRRPRVLGLDVLRIVASFTIIFYHWRFLDAFAPSWLAAKVATDGYLGVDIFFVLSGWLLTRQLLRVGVSFSKLELLAAQFWVRRWMRTLPAYWVALVWVLFPLKRFSPGEAIKHALFVQTLWPPNLYDVSWSLVTEEWFYLGLPLAIFVGLRIRRWKPLAGLMIGIFLIPSAFRVYLLPRGDWNGILAVPAARYEGLVVGATLAVASFFAPWWKTRVMKVHLALFLIGCIGIVALMITSDEASWWYRILGLAGFSILVGCLIPSLSRLRWHPSAPLFVVSGVAFLSELTYSLYLLHQVLPLRRWLALHAGAVYWPASFGLLFGAATCLHLVVERPLLTLRDRWFRRSFSGQGGQAEERVAAQQITGAAAGVEARLVKA